MKYIMFTPLCIQQILFLILVTIAQFEANATVRTVSNYPTAIAQYDNIQAAINASNSGDTIYIYGSPNVYAPFTVQDKKLTFIGPGWSPQNVSTYQAKVKMTRDASIRLIGTGTSGTSFEGLTFEFFNYGYDTHMTIETSGINNIRFSRVNIINMQFRFIPSGNWSGYVFENSILYHGFFFSLYPGSQSFSNFTFRNNYLQGFSRKVYGFTNTNNFLFDHNLFLSTSSSVINAFDADCRNFTLTNNIFVNQNAGANNSLSTFNNNITYNSGENSPWNINGNTDGGGNIANQNPQMASQVSADAGSYAPLADYTINSGPANNSGNDGKDMGLLYDATGIYNWNRSSTSVLPRITALTVSNSSVPAGENLEVSLEAKSDDQSLNITQAEFFIGSDPGVGAGIPITIGSPDDAITGNFNCAIPLQTSPGPYRIGIRVKDVNNGWGLAEFSDITVLAPRDLCDGIDNDGDGLIDEDAEMTTYYADADGDSYGNPNMSKTTCNGKPSGYVANNQDCDDSDPNKWHSETLYIDGDGDGYDKGSTTVCYGANIPAGYIQTTKGSDCNDNDANINPATVWYKDTDNDSYSDGSTKTQCDQPAGYKLVAQLTATNGDCVDDNASIHPGATEICGNGIDENCDGHDDACSPTDTDEDGVPDSEDCAPNDATKWQSAELYIDKDGDGYDNGKETVCYGGNIPAGYKASTQGTDCNDDNAAINSVTIWYKDADNDKYSDGTMLEQCDQPEGYKLSSDLIAIRGDCNDNNAGINPGAQTLTFSGSPLFTQSLVNPKVGTPYTDFSFEIKYADANNVLPPDTYPRLLLDFEGDGLITSANDRIIIMTPSDLNDNNTIDGKLYNAVAKGLRAGSNWKTSVIIFNGSCAISSEVYSYPKVQVLPDLQLFANNISFDNNNPSELSTLTVTAEIYNTSDFAAKDFYVKLLNQYDNTKYPDFLVHYLAPHSSTKVQWSIVTPSEAAWCPMEITVDNSNVINESNELNNSAIRPFINGNYNLPGSIDITSSISPAVAYSGSGYISVTGFGKYTGTPIPLTDPGVAGATVKFTIEETGVSYSSFTDAAGYFLVRLNTPVTPGVYHISGTITDYTLTGTFTGAFTVIEPPCNVDLNVTLNLNTNRITIGQTITGTVIVQNTGCSSVDGNTILRITNDGGSPTLGDITVPPLTSGEKFIQPISVIFNQEGNYSICAFTDALFNISEQDEGNNNICLPIFVQSAIPDIIPLAGPSGTIKICQAPQQINFAVSNRGGGHADAFMCKIVIKRDNVLLDTKEYHITHINANDDFSFGIPFSYDIPGHYNFELTTDAANSIAETNEQNNIAIYSVLVNGCSPDLIYTGCEPINALSENGTYSGNITYVATIMNAGDEMARGPIVLNFQQSDGTVYNTEYNGDLAPGQSANVNVIGIALTPGNSTLTVTIDPLNAIPEQGETNNTIIGNLCWDFSPAARPDGGCGPDFWEVKYRPEQLVNLDVLLNLPPLSLYDANTLKVNFKVKGPGLNGTIDAGDAIVTNARPLCHACGTGPVAALPMPFVFPQEGTYTVIILVDPDNEYAECNEENNIMEVTVNVSKEPDMRIFSHYIAPSKLNPKPGIPINLNITYDNSGASNVEEEMQLDVLVDETLFASISSVNGLVSGDKQTVSIPGSWSSDKVGIHVVRAIIDADNTIEEISEENNSATRGVVVGEAANLYFKSLTPSNFSPQQFSLLNLHAIIANNGDLSCSAIVEWYYRNSGGTLSLIGTTPVTVAANNEVITEINWKVIDPNTTILARIVQPSNIEFNDGDNEINIAIGGLAARLIASNTCGSENGSLKVEVLSGEAPFTYAWNDGQTSETLVAPMGGDYSVIVTDAFGQSIQISGTIPVIQSKLWYRDTDGDGYGDRGNAIQACEPPLGYASNDTDCNDTDATIHPGATEICGNGIDENCDGIDGVCVPVTDSDGDGVSDNSDCAPNDNTKWQSATLYIDADNDGYDNGQTTICYGVTIPDGYKNSTLGLDCNDNNEMIHPGATEICDDGKDNDCDGEIDEGCNIPEPTEFYSKPSGDLHNIMTWGVNPDGSGANPTDFGTGKTFNLANRSGDYMMTGNWTVIGTLNNPSGSQLKISGHTLSLTTLTGMGTLAGSMTSSLMIAGTAGGNFGNINFTSGGGMLKSFTLNRSGSGSAATIGTALSVYDVLTISSGTLNTGGKLTLKSTATNTARVAAVMGSINGNVTVERYIPARRAWRLMNAPVSGIQTVNQAWQEGATTASAVPNPNPGYGTHITGGSLVNGFDQSLQSSASLKSFTASGALQNVSGTNSTLVGNTPYMLFVRGDRSVSLAGTKVPANNTTMRATGTLLTGDQTIPVAVTGYTAVANPFASPINFATITRNNVKNSFYLWDPKMGGTYGVGAYVNVSFNGTGYDVTPASTSPESQYIQSGQSFIVQSTGTAGSLVIKESDKSATPAQNVFRQANPGDQQSAEGGLVFAPAMHATGLRVNLQPSDGSQRGVLDEVFASYSSNFSDEIDDMDALKVENVMENLSIIRKGQELMVDRRNVIQTADTLRLNMTNLTASGYMFEFSPIDLSEAESVTLIDNYLKTTTDISLTATSQVYFLTGSDSRASAPDRFSVIISYTKNRLQSLAGKANIRAYPNPVTANGNINLQFDNMKAGRYRIDIVNSMGQTVYSRMMQLNDGTFNQQMNIGRNLPAGVYQMKITGKTGSDVIKILKR